MPDFDVKFEADENNDEIFSIHLMGKGKEIVMWTSDEIKEDFTISAIIAYAINTGHNEGSDKLASYYGKVWKNDEWVLDR